MKKLALLLGALTVTATAFAGGKEAVPTAGNTTAVREVVKEVVVYRDRTSTNGGNVDMLYKWWGESSKHEHDEDGTKHQSTIGNRGRLQVQGTVNLTEKDKFNFRVRDNHWISSYDGKDGYGKKSTDVRLRYYRNHDFLDGMATSRVLYRNGSASTYGTADADHNLEYNLGFNFADKLFDNSVIKTTNFSVGPTVGYAWQDAGTANAQTTYYGGVELATSHSLPWNFSFDFNVYARYFNTNKAIYEAEKNAFITSAEFYLYNDTTIWSGDKASVSFHFEGGFDPYQYSTRKLYSHDRSNAKDETSAYTLYALPYFQFDYQATESLNLYAAAGVYYYNLHTTNGEQGGYVWMPNAWVGFNKKF